MKMQASMVTLLVLGMLSSVSADEDAVLVLKGIGTGGRKKYEGGKVEFLDVSIADQLVHLASPERIPLRLSIRYRVLTPAPVLLNSRMGTEYWHLYHYQEETTSGLHTLEPIDLSKEAEATATVDDATADPSRGSLLSKGLVGIRGHYYFLVDQPDGKWLDVVRPPAFFYRIDLARKLAFTLANLSQFSLQCTDIESTWSPGGPVRIKLTVRDADGEQFPVVNAAAEAQAGEWSAPLRTEMDEVHLPTGWLSASLPQGAVPEKVTVRATVSAMAPDGPTKREVSKTFARGEGQKTITDMRAAPQPIELPRNGDGVIRETRALWVSTKALLTKEGIETLVSRAHEAGVNMMLPDIFVRTTLLAKSPLFPMSNRVEEDFDPLGYLIKLAHEKGIEVHPWFCVTYRDKAFREHFPGVDMLDANGNVLTLGADIHRPAYRDFVVDLMVGVARDYDVDGIHLDYIRTMGHCYCDRCRAEFQEKFGKPLTEATDEEWMAWQKAAVGQIVRRTAEGVNVVKPDAIMSSAVFSNVATGGAQGRDPVAWARRGWMDIVIPMDYRMDTLVMRTNEKNFLAALDDDEKLVTGLSLYMRSGETAMPRRPDLVREQIQVIRRLGIHGYCLFCDVYLSDEIMQMLKKEINQERAVPYFR